MSKLAHRGQENLTLCAKKGSRAWFAQTINGENTSGEVKFIIIDFAGGQWDLLNDVGPKLFKTKIPNENNIKHCYDFTPHFCEVDLVTHIFLCCIVTRSNNTILLLKMRHCVPLA